MRALVDWLPFLAVLVVYDLSRGLANDIGMPVQVEALVNVERFIFGGLPTVWLQNRLYPSNDGVSWWELGVAVVYASHFVGVFSVAAVLWIRDRALWLKFVWRYLMLNALGIVTYVLLPAAPPWMAADRGLIPPLERSVGRGWSKIDFGAAPQILQLGRLSVNSVAALPSLHAGYSMLIVAFLWPRVTRRKLRPLLLIYPFAMAFTLLYGGEHYAIDVIAGWLYVWAAFAAVRWIAGRSLGAQ